MRKRTAQTIVRRDQRNSESAGPSKIYFGAFKKLLKWL